MSQYYIYALLERAHVWLTVVGCCIAIPAKAAALLRIALLTLRSLPMSTSASNLDSHP